MFATRTITTTIIVLALLASCSKKEEKAPTAAQPQPTETAKLIEETKRNAGAVKAQQGSGAAALPYSKLPDLLDQLASHMEARAQARQQGADTSEADTQISSDVTQLQEIQNNMSTFQPEGEKKPALDRLSENLTKVIQIVNEGRELKATLKSIRGEGGIQPEANVSQDSFAQSNDAVVAAAQESNPASSEPGPTTESVSSGSTAPESTGDPDAKSGDQPTLAAAKLPVEKMAAVSSCCTVVSNPAMKGRLGRLVVTYPEGTKANARIGVSKGGTEATSAYGSKAFELLPGSYTVVISGKQVDNVMVQSGHDTTVKVGVLRVTAPGGTRIGVLDKDGKTELISGYGSKEFGLPIGTVHVSVAGQSEPVTIMDGKITDF